jgi:hypothetical protein
LLKVGIFREVLEKSPTHSQTTSYYWAQAQEERHNQEKDAYKSLVDEGGIPSYSIEQAFDIMENSEKEWGNNSIATYWLSRAGGGRMVLCAQLGDWRRFCKHQQDMRQKSFSGYERTVRRVRRAHKIGRAVKFYQDARAQSQLLNWLEYQVYCFLTLEDFENKIEDLQKTLGSRQKKLSNATGLRGIEQVHGLNKYDKTFEAGKEKELAEGELAIAEERLRLAQLPALGDTIRFAVWTKLASEEARLAIRRKDEIMESQGNKSPHHFDRETWTEWCSAGRDYHWGAKVWQAGMDDFRNGKTPVTRDPLTREESVHKAALMSNILAEVRSAQARLDKARKASETVVLQVGVIEALAELEGGRKCLDKHKILLEWIEQQLEEIATRTADLSSRNGDKAGRLQQSKKRIHRNRSSGPSTRHGNKGEQKTAHSGFKSANPSRISKMRRVKPGSRQENVPKDLGVQCDTEEARN